MHYRWEFQRATVLKKLAFGQENGVRRQQFITLMAVVAMLWPIVARAQPPDHMRRIGMLMSNYTQSDREGQARITMFLDAFRKLGWSDGRNVAIEYRWGAGDADLGKAAATELVRASPDVIVGAAGNPALAELQLLTSTIPIVFVQISDPIESGFVRSLAHPGGNTTGFTNFESAIGGKWLGTLKEAAPNMSRAAVLFGSDSLANVGFLRAAEAVAPSLGVELTALDMHDGIDIDHAIATFAGKPDGGLIVVPHPATAETEDRSSYWRPAIACLRSIRFDISQPRAA
jgi:putative tryptophan/tyrosine transport system substrate-binding protein